MSEKRIGTLIYDPSMGRFDIRFGIESYYGGLHCGECFDVKVKDAGTLVKADGTEIKITTDTKTEKAEESTGSSETSDVKVSEDVIKEVETAKEEESKADNNVIV